MNKVFPSINFCLIFVSISFISCKNDPSSPEELIQKEPIILTWNKSDFETREDLETGMKWYFSMLGAELTSKSWASGIEWITSSHIAVMPKTLGFNQNATDALYELWSSIKQTEDYRLNEAIDIGRFVAATLNNSNHYYKIVGMPQNLATFQKNSHFLNIQAAIYPSTVSFGYRKIFVPDPQSVNLAFIAEEYKDNFAEDIVNKVETEVLDVMPNGQIRFAIYEDGYLRQGANQAFSLGGKPTKCMWCHESSFLPNFAGDNALGGYISHADFNDTIEFMNRILKDKRSHLDSFLDFEKKMDHAQMELLYIRFYEPSLQRLAGEWGLSVEEVSERLIGLTTHQHHEFPELGELYYRHEVDVFAPFKSLSVPKNMREAEENQPDLL